MLLFLLFSVFGHIDFCSEKELKRSINESSIIMKAEIVEIGKPPLTFSDSTMFVFGQMVKYKPKTFLKGTIESKRIVVGHSIVEDAPNVENLRPRLAPAKFFRGAEVLLFVKRASGCNTKEFSEDSPCFEETNFACSVIPHTKRSMKIVEVKIRNSKSATKR